MQFVIEVQGVEELDEKFAGYARRAADARPVWDDVARAITEDQAEWFDSQGESTWKPLNKRYAAWKAKSRYADRPPGVLTGRLRNSLATQGGSREYSVLRWDADELEVGTSDPVAGLQLASGRPPLGAVLPGEQEHYLGLLRNWVMYGEESPL